MTTAKNNAKWMARLMKAEGAVKRDYNPFMHGLRFSSPGMNFLFGNTHCLPDGFILCVWGPPKSGKTIGWYDLVGQMHRDDPEAWAIRYDCEFKEKGQLTDRIAKNYGIDFSRYMCYETNQPEHIFDHIEKELPAMIQDGMKLRALCIDPLSNIQGRRAQTAGGVLTQQRGDRAQTLQDGLQRIWPILAKYRIAFYITCQARAEQDPIKLMQHKVIRQEAAWFVKHFGGYTIRIEPVDTSAGRKDVLGNEYANDAMKAGNTGKDNKGRGEQTAHRVRATMEGNSFGPKNRQIEFTFDDINGGIINTWEEAYTLGINRNVVKKSTTGVYTMDNWPSKGEESVWRGKDNFAKALQDNEDLRKEIVARIREQDISIMEMGTRSPFWRTEEAEDKAGGMADE